MEKGTIIEISSLCKDYESGKERVKALDNVDLTVKKGELLAISGASGSGKTTLLNLIGTLDSISSGTILFGHYDLSKMNEKEKTSFRRLNLGFVFQSYNLIPVLTAWENVELAFQPLSKSEKKSLGIQDFRKASYDALKSVGLEGLEMRKPGELSGGQQQRVSIARAIVRRPSLILADEPTANLDSTNSILILKLLKELNEKYGITIIYSSHDQEVLDSVNRVVILKDGKVLEDRRC